MIEQLGNVLYLLLYTGIISYEDIVIFLGAGLCLLGMASWLAGVIFAVGAIRNRRQEVDVWLVFAGNPFNALLAEQWLTPRGVELRRRAIKAFVQFFASIAAAVAAAVALAALTGYIR